MVDPAVDRRDARRVRGRGQPAQVATPDRAEAGVLEQPIEVQPRVVGGEKVGGLATAVEVWLTFNAYQTHRFEKYDDRDRAATEAHGEKGQQLGEAWANAISRHSGKEQARLERSRAARAPARGRRPLFLRHR